MPWPEAIGSLLARPASPAGQALRWGLHGLRASLQAALAEVSPDSGTADLRALVTELTSLMEPSTVASRATLPLDSPAAPPDPTQATGPPARRDPRVAEPVDDALRPLAEVVAACLWLVAHDAASRHCLKSVFRFGLAPVTGDQRERYVAELLRLWERVQGGGLGLKEQLKARLDLDEALHSVIRQPPTADGSWWAKLQSQARATLFAARDQAVRSGLSVYLQELGGSFAEINRLAPDSIQVDFGVPGEVSACLRVWARVDGEELKGRVLYRSPEDGS
jgi:hypothetical protein